MSALFLPSFEVRGFRAFEDLHIERLGRVNLIVGKNNVGKSSLLEALQVYTSKGFPPLLWELLRARDESTPQTASHRPSELADLLRSIRYLFFGRGDVIGGHKEFQLGPLGTRSARLTITVQWVPYPAEQRADSRDDQRDVIGVVTDTAALLGIRWGALPTILYKMELTPSAQFPRPELQPATCIAVNPPGLSNERSAELWDAIALTDLQPAVIDALHLITPGVMGVSFVAGPNGNVQERIPIVRVSGLDEPIPLRSLGDGMQRMLGIALALVNAKDGILLIDEVENGLHYQVLPQLWRLIFQTAERLNVQVFATTHSWDCIQTFQSVADAERGAEGVLIRLELRKDKVAATLFDERELTIATREQIEVR